MRVGVPKEIKTHEYRVGMVPAGVRELVGLSHDVLVETRAGEGIGFADAVHSGRDGLSERPGGEETG